MNFYEILGVSKNATAEELKTAYRAKAMEHHPDKGGDKDTFAHIAEAYNVLSNPKLRKMYDTTGMYQIKSRKEMIREKAISNVAALLQSLIQKRSNEPGFFFLNLVDVMREFMTDQILPNISTSIKELKKEIKKLKKIKSRLSCRSNFDVLSSLLDQQINSMIENIKNQKSEKLVAEAVLDILKDYDYKADAKKTTNTFNNSSISFSLNWR